MTWGDDLGGSGSFVEVACACVVVFGVFDVVVLDSFRFFRFFPARPSFSFSFASPIAGFGPRLGSPVVDFELLTNCRSFSAFDILRSVAISRVFCTLCVCDVPCLSRLFWEETCGGRSRGGGLILTLTEVDPFWVIVWVGNDSDEGGNGGGGETDLGGGGGDLKPFGLWNARAWVLVRRVWTT